MNSNRISGPLPFEDLQVFENSIERSNIDLFSSLWFEDSEYEFSYRSLLAIETEQQSTKIYNDESRTNKNSGQEYTTLLPAIQLPNIEAEFFNQTVAKEGSMVVMQTTAYPNVVLQQQQQQQQQQQHTHNIPCSIENYSAMPNNYQNGFYGTFPAATSQHHDIFIDMNATIRTAEPPPIASIDHGTDCDSISDFPFEEHSVINAIKAEQQKQQQQRPTTQTVTYLSFLVQPQSTLSFRFKSEVQRTSCGFLMGETSTRHLKTNPIVQLKTSRNLLGKTIYLHVDLFQKESEQSPHFLHSANNNNGLIIFEMTKVQFDSTDGGCFTVNFSIEKLFAVRTKPKHFQTAIATKIFQFQKWTAPSAIQGLDDIRRCVYWHNDHRESNCVMLGCRVFLDENGILYPITERIYSKNIYLKSK